jgi:hypothetical protein
MNISKYILPALVIAALFGGYFLRSAFTQPTTNVNFNQKGSATLQCTVEGLKCKGTANFFTKMYEGRQGISSIETFATEHLAVFTYNPSVISSEDIVTIMETPVPLRDGSRRQVFRCVEVK